MEFIETKKGRAIVTDRNVEVEPATLCDCCGQQTQEPTLREEVFYQNILSKDHKANAIVRDGILTIGNKKVLDYDTAKFAGNIPMHLTIRQIDESLERPYPRFVSGFDILNDGRYWLQIGDNGKEYFNTFKEVDQFLIDAGYTNYNIYTEDDFRM